MIINQIDMYEFANGSGTAVFRQSGGRDGKCCVINKVPAESP
jgi:hypothetical protein